jgi:diguanylate cyclase (GGDEF)-like protein/PAS domain S-box-containing protein
MRARKIMVVEDDAIVAEDLRSMLEELGYNVPAAALSGREALDIARATKPDLGLVDVGLPGDMDGVDLALALREEMALPVVFITGRRDPVTSVRMRTAHSYGYVRKPFTEEGLSMALSIALERIRDEARLARRERHYRKLYEESVAGVAQFTLTGRLLEANHAFARDLGYDSPAELKAAANPDLWLSDRRDLMSELGAVGRVADQEVLLQRRDGSTLWMLCNTTLVEFGQRTVLLGTFFNLDRRKQAEGALKRLAYRDPLTGLANRRLLALRGAQILEEARRRGEYASFLYMDLVGFKQINDLVGHAAGDAVLVQLAQRLEATQRSSDLVARLGGDEFGALLGAASDAEGALQAARRFLSSLEPLYGLGSGPIRVPVRAGVAVFPEHAQDLTGLINAADEALAEATRQGGANLFVARPR